MRQKPGEGEPGVRAADPIRRGTDYRTAPRYHNTTLLIARSCGTGETTSESCHHNTTLLFVCARIAGFPGLLREHVCGRQLLVCTRIAGRYHNTTLLLARSCGSFSLAAPWRYTRIGCNPIGSMWGMWGMWGNVGYFGLIY
jgi:hypothetical protein